MQVEVHVVNCGDFVGLEVGMAKHRFYALKLLEVYVRTQLAACVRWLAQLPVQPREHVRGALKFGFELRPRPIRRCLL